MKRTEQSVRKINTFNQGVDTDTNEKILGAASNQKAIDQRNMVSRGKDDKVLKFVGGETLVYGDENTDFECIGSFSVNNHVVEVWVNSSGSLTQFKIDGDVMLETDKLDFDAQHPLQGDTNDRCDGGELYTTDDKNPIYLFNIQNIIENYNAGNDTYFAGFDPVIYQATLQTSPHHPVYAGLERMDGAGLNVGKYNYAIRYSDDSGNRTGWSVQTPNIPVPANDGLASSQFPGIKTYGAIPGTPTNYGIKIKFRVDNVGGYQYIEIRRVAYRDGLQMGYVPTPKYIKLANDANDNPIDILNNPIGIIEFIDSASYNEEWQDLTDEEDTIGLTGSFSAKTLRYYQNRLVAMNITYPSRDLSPYIDDMFVVKNDKLGFPVIEKITTDIDRRGFQDIDNQVNYPALQTGEKYGWGAYIMDDFGARTFVVPFDDNNGHDLRNAQIPNRREPLMGDSLEYSVNQWKGAAKAATITSTQPGSIPTYTHEVFDLVGAREKTEYCTFKNILNKGNKSVGKVNNSAPYKDNCDPGQSNGGYVHGEDLGHLVYSPTADNDGNVSGHNYRVNMYVKNVVANSEGYPVQELAKHPYHPKGFSPNYYSIGYAFNGFKELPDWARAISIVRTKPAGRVVCQGIGFWEFKKDNAGATSKFVNRLRFYSPDMDLDLTGTVSMQTLVDNPSAYKVQLVSPLGAFSEVYDGEKRTITGTAVGDVEAYRGVDMAVYVRQLFERGKCNPTYSVSEIGNNDGYISYGRWLNSVSSGYPQANIWATSNGNKVINLKSANILHDGRSTMLQIDLEEDIYINAGINTAQFAARDPKFWGEPIYMINIIREDAEVAHGNMTSYIETGHLQKLDSRIGVGNGNANQEYELVDERWEDCIPNALNPNVSEENRYVYIDGKPWLNITYKTSIFITDVVNDLTASGYADISDFDLDGNSIIKRIYGVYTNIGTPGTDTSFTIRFNYTSPPQDANINVRYDNRIPIKVFAGDTVTAENNFVPYDRQSDRDAGIVDQLWLHTGFPYQKYYINDRVYLVKRTTATFGGWIQDENDVNIKFIRQMLVNFICESKVNVPLLFGDRYPHVNYVMRPHRWKNGSEDDPLAFLTANNMSFGGATAYYDDYGFEWNNWQYGGFHLGGHTNIDYQKFLNDRNNFSKPLLGFREQTRFCTRILWSNPRNINRQDDPNLRSFPILNVYDISDAYGEIKYAYDNDSSKGNNLFAITDKGTCLLITDKRILSDFTGNEIANIKTDSGFMQGEYWLSKEIGCNDEMWRGIAEYNNQIFIPNKNGVYMMTGFSIRDILRGDDSIEEGRGMSGYRVKLLPILRGISQNYYTPMCATYDWENNEYLLHVGSIPIRPENPGDKVIFTNPKTFIFSNDPGKQFWSGETDYDFQKMVYVPKYVGISEGRVFGQRKYQTYRLGVGNNINNIPAIKEVLYAITPAINQTMEFIDGTVNSTAKPTRLGFAHTLLSMEECHLLGTVIRDYTNAYYFMVPRKETSPNDRLQNDCFIVKVVHDTAGDFRVASIETGFKPIKW